MDIQEQVSARRAELDRQRREAQAEKHREVLQQQQETKQAREEALDSLATDLSAENDVVIKRKNDRLQFERPSILPTIEPGTLKRAELKKMLRREARAEFTQVHLLPKFGRLHLDQLNQTQILEWMAAKVAEGYAQATVNRWHVILGHMMRMAKKWEMPGAERNPLDGVKQKDPNNKVERFLTPEETARLKAAVDASPNPMLAPIVALLLLTGARKRELLDATWDQFDLDRADWRIPTSKTGKPRHVPLSDDAVAVLRSLTRHEGCAHVVPNPKTLKPFTSIFNSWNQARKKARLPDVRVHDLRHSAASNMANAGESLYVIGKVLGHAQAKTTERYAHLSGDTLRKAVNAASQVSGTTWAS